MLGLALLIAGCGSSSAPAAKVTVTPPAQTVTVKVTTQETSLPPRTITDSQTKTVTQTQERTTTVNASPTEEAADAVNDVATGSEPTPETSAATQAEPEATFAARSGYTAKAVGQLAGVVRLDGSNTRVINFRVVEIRPAFVCTSERPRQAQNGAFLGIRLSIEVLPVFNPETDSGLSVSSYDFKIVGADGVIENTSVSDSVYACLEESDAVDPNQQTAGTTTEGWVVLDTKHTHGSLLLTQNWAGTTGGWEWKF